MNIEEPASKWLEFVECGWSGKPGRIVQITNRWDVSNKMTGSTIGVVKWFGAWRKYAFYPKQGTIFEPTCLRDIASFCEVKTAQHRDARKLLNKDSLPHTSTKDF